MPPAIRARKAQHSAAPISSPTPEAAEREVISAVSSAPRAPRAEASPQHSQASARAGVRSARSGGHAEEEVRGGSGGRQGQDPRAQQGEHQPAQRQGPQHQGQQITEAASHGTNLSIRYARVRRAGSSPRRPSYGGDGTLVPAEIEMYKYMDNS